MFGVEIPDADGGKIFASAIATTAFGDDVSGVSVARLLTVDSDMSGAVFGCVGLDVGYEVRLGLGKLTVTVVGFEISANAIPGIKVVHGATRLFGTKEIGVLGAGCRAGTAIAGTSASGGDMGAVQGDEAHGARIDKRRESKDGAEETQKNGF